MGVSNFWIIRVFLQPYLKYFNQFCISLMKCSNFAVLTRIGLYLQADKVKFQLRLGQSKPIYNAFKAIQEFPDWQTLSDARKRIVESTWSNSRSKVIGHQLTL